MPAVLELQEAYKKIQNDPEFQQEFDYYLNNRAYDIESPDYGKSLTTIRFNDCDQYDFKTITNEIEKILSKCINHNSAFLKRRDIGINTIPDNFVVDIVLSVI